MSDARKNQRSRRRDLFWLGDAFRFRAQIAQRAPDRRQISGTVINDRKFHSSPFVVGKTRRNCRSRVTAKRSARAKALNITST